MKKRLLYIDQLRGLAILLVVMGHFLQYNTVESTGNRFFGFIYSFHMPLFMFISGYVAQKTISPAIFLDYFSFLKKKSIALLLPFFAWPLIADHFFFTTAAGYRPVATARTLITAPEGGLWFLWFLFFITLLFSLFLFASGKINRKGNIVIDLAIVVCQLALLTIIHFTSLISYIDSFMLYCVFFYLGVFIARFGILSKLALNKHFFTAVLVLFLVFSGYYNFLNPNIIVKLVLSFTGIFSLFYIANTINWHPFVDKTVRHWGVNSLAVYTTHFTLMSLLPVSWRLSSLPFVPLLCITLFFSCIVIFICITVFKIVKLSPLLGFLFYGNRSTT